MDRSQWLAEKHAEAAQLGVVRLSEVTPSRRDFRLYVAGQREELALIARIQSNDRAGLATWRDADLLAHAVASDDADIAALAVVTDQQRGGSTGLMKRVAAATQAPVLRDDLVLSPAQLYDARLHGADAVVLPAADLAAAALAELMHVAISLHMAAVVEVQATPDIEKALAMPHAVIGFNADVGAIDELTSRIPPSRTRIVLREPDAIDELRSLRGKVDAVTLGPAHLIGHDLSALLARLNGR
ncbi:MAG TPA: hypothetical protein VMW17_16285 [Candidatus Binatia bacterium]|nr:hypothetical protein [Candidatus Binatia bacterium]